MAKCILIYGKSGAGKSRSLKNFDENEVFLIQSIKKELPFRKKFTYSMVTDNAATIIQGLQKMPTDIAVIDDAGYLQTNAFMRGHSAPKKGSNSFDLYNDIADSFWSLLNAIRDIPDEKTVYIVMHEQTSDYGDTKLRTIGKLLDDKVCIEGMITIVLRCLTNAAGKHYFRTQTDGSDITKSPEEMFPEIEIENDLKAVDLKIREYYGMPASTIADPAIYKTKKETK